jgi:excisionase family DNA binding protein
MRKRNGRILPQRQAAEWFTPKEAADHLSVHVESIYDACRARGLRHLKLGHSTIRIRRAWLDAWVEQHAR